MPTTRKPSEPSDKPRRRRATTPERRERQIIGLAVDLSEKQIREGTVSSQVLSHYLKLGSTTERLAQERLMREIDMIERKAASMDSAKRVEELYEEALGAMRSYQGLEPEIHE